MIKRVLFSRKGGNWKRIQLISGMKNFVFVVNKYRRCINGQKYHSIFGENQNLNHFYTYTNSLTASASPFHAGYLSPCFYTYMFNDHISLIVCTVILPMTTTFNIAARC